MTDHEARKTVHHHLDPRMRGESRMYEVVTHTGRLLAKCPNLEDARDVQNLFYRKLRGQGFESPPYPGRLVEVRVESDDRGGV